MQCITHQSSFASFSRLDLGTQAFNVDPENARLADDYAIVMGSSHCEQMLRNNEGEWKAVDEQARREGRRPPLGDFNYITNRQTMHAYWEERVKTNGQYENTYTLGLRGIHDYPMEGANTTAERVRLMQQAIDDQRDMLRRNIDRPIEQIPQVLCTYEEVLDAYHNGLQVPDDVIMLWSDDKQGYTRNLCNPDEMKRSGGAGIYYHLSYHGDPASWIWLSPLAPSFLSTELTKAYTFGARKVWVFNVGDIKPAEKEISFVMDMAWDVDRWAPLQANGYIRQWAAETFGAPYADEIASLLAHPSTTSGIRRSSARNGARWAHCICWREKTRPLVGRDIQGDGQSGCVCRCSWCLCLKQL